MHQVAGPLRHVVEVADPLPAAKSVSLRSKFSMKPLRSVPPTEEPLAAELLGQMEGMLVRHDPTCKTRAAAFGVCLDDAVARYSAPKTLAA